MLIGYKHLILLRFIRYIALIVIQKHQWYSHNLVILLMLKPQQLILRCIINFTHLLNRL